MNQSKLSSFVESLINVFIGAIVALISQLIVFPVVGINVSIETNLEIMAYFTLISVIRSYVIRRWFNARLHNLALKIARES